MKKYDVLLFDLDHTLLDFEAGEVAGFKAVLSFHHLEFSDSLLKQYQQINQHLWGLVEKQAMAKQTVLTQRFIDFFQSLGIRVDGVEEETIFRKYINQNGALLPYAKECLELCRHKGYRLFSATNGLYETQMKRMHLAGIDELFEGHFISDQIGVEKPHSTFFKVCLEKTGCNPHQILMIGDSYRADILGGHQAGMDTCWITPSTSPQGVETIRFESVRELSDWLV